jgi:hypothetical protein
MCGVCSDEYKSVADFFALDGKIDELDIQCTKQIPLLQKALAHLRPFVYMLP